MVVHNRRQELIEAALDPRGKWYGTAWPERPAEPEPEPVVPDETLGIEPDDDATPWMAPKDRASWDEWEPS
jgi:hypothetical protein